MRLTIVKDDSAVYVDGKPHQIDCSNLPAEFHALQWDGASGEVEFQTIACASCGCKSRNGNALITDVAPYQPLVDAWNAAEAREKAEVELAAAARAAAGAEMAEKIKAAAAIAEKAIATAEASHNVA